MAYAKQKQRILAGSLNLVPPADKLPEEDSLALQNWRVDQQGELHSRRPVKCICTGLAAAPHTLFASDSEMFAGAGPQLYTGGSFSTALGAGFSGEPMGIVKYQGYDWFMDRSRQVKLKTGTTNLIAWSIAAPASAPAAAAVGTPQANVPVASFAASEAWTFVPVDSASISFDAGPQGFASAMKLKGTVPSQVTAFLSPSTARDLRINGVASDSDRLKVSFKTDGQAVIASISVIFSYPVNYGSVGTTAGAKFAKWEVKTSQKTWTDGEWHTFSCPRKVQPVDFNDDTLYVDGSAIAGSADFDWSAVTHIQVRVVTAAACTVWVGGVCFVPNPEMVPDGEFTYFVTFVNASGHESNPSPESAEVTSDGQSLTLSAVPVSTDPQVTGRRIYRHSDGLSVALRVGAITDNTTTTFTDTMSVADQQALGEELPLDHDLAPACRGLVGPYFGKLVAFNSAAHPNRIWWTPTGQPSYVPGSDDDGEGNWLDVGEDGEEIVAVSFRKKLLIIYKERSIWRLAGDPDDNNPEQCNSMVGISGGERAVTTWGTVDYFRAPGGVYSFNGDTEAKISQKIDPLFHGEAVEIAAGEYAQPVNAAVDCALGAKNGKLYLSYAEIGSASPNALLVYDTDSGRWAREKIDASLGTGPKVLCFDGGTGTLYAGLGAGVYQLDAENGAFTDEGASIPLLWQSGFLDQGLPDNAKLYADLVIDYRTGTDLTVSCCSTTARRRSSVRLPQAHAGGHASASVRTARVSLGAGGHCCSTCLSALTPNMTRE